jgi:predicted nicotinamide N-methyase
LRAYVDDLMNEKVEDMSDRLFGLLAEVQSKAQETAGFISFDIPCVDSKSKDVLRSLDIKVDPIHNEVGLRAWEAGYFLTEFILCKPESVDGLRLVELGAGLGFTGMAAAYVSQSSQIVLTDCSRDVLDNLSHGVALNSLSARVAVKDLDWTIGGKAAKEIVGDVDAVFAADVLYDPVYVPPFVEVVAAFLDSAATLNVAYIAATLRNPATLELFFDEVSRRKIPIFESDYSWREVLWKKTHAPQADEPRSGMPLFHYDPRSVRLFALGRRPGVDWAPLIRPGA